MSRRAETELKAQGAEINDVAAAEDRVLRRLTVYRGQSLGRGHEGNVAAFPEFNPQVMVPNARILNLKFVLRRTSDPKRQTAGDPLGACLGAVQDVKGNHRSAEGALLVNDDLVVRKDGQIELGVFSGLLPVHRFGLAVGAAHLDL